MELAALRSRSKGNIRGLASEKQHRCEGARKKVNYKANFDHTKEMEMIE